jgi:hypothetical protein
MEANPVDARRLRLIDQAVWEIHRCEDEIKAGNHEPGGPWLGYMDWLEELHGLIHDYHPEYYNHR